MDDDAKLLPRVDQTLGDVKVLLAGRRIAARMIVNQYECGRSELQRPTHDLARINRGLLHRSP